MVRGKNEYLYGSVRAEMVVKVEASEKRVNFVGLLNLSTEMDTLPATALPNMLSRDSFLRSERVDQPRSSKSLDTEVVRQ